MHSNRLYTLAVLLILLLMFAYCQFPSKTDESGQIQLKVTFAKSNHLPKNVQEATEITQITVAVLSSDGSLITTPLNLEPLVSPQGQTTWSGGIEIEPADSLTVVARAFEGPNPEISNPDWKGEKTGLKVEANKRTTADIILRRCGVRKIGCEPDPECCQ
ncbi:MAG: hypothetical protein ACE5HO_04790 [bacterium]